MKKSKILVALLLAAVMVFSVVSMVACKKDKIELLVWAPSNAQTFYKEWADKWAADYKDADGNQYKVKLGIMSEGDCGSTVQSAPQDAADVFCFADDQLPDLVEAGGLSAIGDPNDENATLAKDIAARNVDASVASATYIKDGKLYAYPMQADNCYFLYYNSSVLSEEDVKTWDGIFAKVEDGMKVQLDYGVAWYQAAWFFAYGGTASLSDTNFDSDEVGLKALKAAHWFSSHVDQTVFVNPDDAKQGMIDGDIVAAVAGSWIYSGETGVSANENIKLAVLPSLTLGGETVPMKSFLGSKLIGVNGQGKYQAAAHALANYLTSEEVQTAKATALAAGPSNKNSAASDAAKALPMLSVIDAQRANSVPQINLPKGFWSALPTCVDAMNAKSEKIGTYYDLEAYPDTYGYNIEGMKALLAALRVNFKLEDAAE